MTPEQALAIIRAHGIAGPVLICSSDDLIPPIYGVNHLVRQVQSTEVPGTVVKAGGLHHAIPEVNDFVLSKASARGPSDSIPRLVHVVDRLLGPGGCPWDIEQTHSSLKKYLLEEAYELMDAIDSGNLDAMKEELGDLLLQPIMHAQMEQRDGGWGINEVADAICDKLIRRHPHVFGTAQVADSEEVLQNWDAIKKSEKGKEGSILGGVPKAMAALLRAHEVSKRAARVGFEWPDIDAVFAKLDEERAELHEAIAIGRAEHIESELGDLLFTVVNIARWLKVEPEDALRKMLDRFTTRFQAMEQAADRPLRELSAAEWDDLWTRAKLDESKNSHPN